MPSQGTELRPILRLLDDDNPTVRAAVKEKLASFGEDLRALLESEVQDADLDLRERAVQLQREYRQEDFLRQWLHFVTGLDRCEDLEKGLVLLAGYLDSSGSEVQIPKELDELAEGFLEESLFPEFRNLANYLFSSAMFTGDTERYYHPDNSNLKRVLYRKKGNPISLACVFILVGKRLELDVGGCNYPAHFLARATCARSGELFLVDCFNDGRVISAKDLILYHPLADQEVHQVVSQPATTRAILSRVLRNLENSFRQNNLGTEEQFAAKLQTALFSHNDR